MIDTAPISDTADSTLPAATLAFYRRSMELLGEAGVPFLVGGAYAYARYTGIVRHTKDFDVFVHPRDFDSALDAFAAAGYRVDRTFPHWLGKAFHGDDFVDLIFSSGNGVARVDDRWFKHAVPARVLGVATLLVPAEEMIWSKSFILERERFDGADVAHVLLCRGAELDWRRLLDRFGDEHWRVLLAHLVLFPYIYPDDAGRLPGRVVQELLGRLRDEPAPAVPRAAPDSGDGRLCRGPILSRGQYLVDVEPWGYRDARRTLGLMSAEDVAHWTEAAREEAAKQLEHAKE